MVPGAEIEQVVGANLQPSTGMVLRLGSVVEQHRAEHAGVSRHLHSGNPAVQSVRKTGAVVDVDDPVRAESGVQVHSGQSRFKAGSLGMDVEHGRGYEACAVNHAETAWRFGKEEAAIGGKSQRPWIIEASSNIFCMQRFVIGHSGTGRWRGRRRGAWIGRR